MAEDDVRGLASDTRKFHELVHRLRHLALVVLDHLARHPDERSGFRAEETGGLDLRLEFVGGRLRERRSVGIALEQCRRHLVDAFVRALRREDRRNQQLVGVGEVQFSVRIRMLRRKRREDLLRISGSLRRFGKGWRGGALGHGHTITQLPTPNFQLPKEITEANWESAWGLGVCVGSLRLGVVVWELGVGNWELLFGSRESGVRRWVVGAGFSRPSGSARSAAALRGGHQRDQRLVAAKARRADDDGFTDIHREAAVDDRASALAAAALRGSICSGGGDLSFELQHLIFERSQISAREHAHGNTLLFLFEPLPCNLKILYQVLEQTFIDRVLFSRAAFLFSQPELHLQLVAARLDGEIERVGALEEFHLGSGHLADDAL